MPTDATTSRFCIVLGNRHRRLLNRLAILKSDGVTFGVYGFNVGKFSIFLCCGFECSGLPRRAEPWRGSAECWKWEFSAFITCRQKPHQNIRCTEQIFQLRQGCFRLGHTATRRRGCRGSYCTHSHFLCKELDYRYNRLQGNFPLNDANKNTV